MAKETMRRHAADNHYLHRDFHTSLSGGIDFLAEQYGGSALEAYLARIGREFYAPLIARIRQQGLSAVEAEFHRVYAQEEDCPDAYRARRLQYTLFIDVLYCPAVRHIRAIGAEVSPYFSATTSAVWRAICEGAGIGYMMLAYEERTGAACHWFYEKGADA